jgi:hypothetical protein
VVSANGVHRVLSRHGLGTRAKRLGLIAGYAAPPGPTRPQPEPERHCSINRLRSAPVTLWSSGLRG